MFGPSGPRRRAIPPFLVSSVILVGVIGLFTDRPLRAVTTLTPGNLAIYRVGTGSAALTSAAAAVFVDEYTTAGTLVQSIAMPTSTSGSSRRLVASGSATSEGFLSRSTDGHFLVMTGYDAAVGTASIAGTASTTVNRIIGRLDAFGNVDTTTALTDFANANNPRSAASTNGVDLWVAGAGGSSGGVRYATLGGAISTSLIATNSRSVEIFGGQLYTSSNNPSGLVGSVGSGLPTTSGQAITNLVAGGSPFAYFLADLSPAVPGVDTLYIADDGGSAPGGITKYSLVSGSWVSNGTVGAAADAYRGLTGVVNAGAVTLYSTRKANVGASGGEIVSLADSSGYNGAFSGTPSLLATAGTNMVFRGVALTPVPAAASVILTVSTSTASEAAKTVVTVTANASAPVAGAQTVDLTVGGSGITSGDYTLSSSTITIPHGMTSGSVTFTAVDDALVEGPEVATLTLVNPSAGITLGSPVSRTVTIIDNDHPFPGAAPDGYVVEAGTTLSVGSAAGVLANDAGGPLAVFSHTTPAHGTATMNADGSFQYTPAPGFFGVDTFDYAASNLAPVYNLQVYPVTGVPPLGTFGAVALPGAGFGSSFTPVPGSPNEFYGVTDRGPNVTGPGGILVVPVPTFNPAIGKFKLVGGQAVFEGSIVLHAADGTPYSGLVNSQADTGETLVDVNGVVQPKDPHGYDSEGLVALPDGSFWVSDEYGPFITHFDASGKEIGRLSPFNLSLPGELRNRVINRGMEGLTVTPDGGMLVAIMQSSLQQADLNGFDAKKLTPLRIVTYRFSDGAEHEYLYLLDNPNANKTAVSEIAALSNTSFLVDERDGNFPPGAFKKLFMIDLTGATDIGPQSTVPGSAYNAASGGLLFSGSTIENLLRSGGTPFDTATSLSALAGLGITPVSKDLYVDVGSLLDNVDPQGKFFSHDKLEGVAIKNGGATLYVSNDSDFGIVGVTNDTAPFTLAPKITPAGVQDDGEVLSLDLVRSTATVTITVVDTIAPDTTLTSMPSNPANSSSAGFWFTGSDSGSGVAGFQCSLDASAFTSCVTGVMYNGLADGAHTFEVRAVDGANNADLSPASWTWTVDTTPPVINSLTASPSSLWPVNKKMIPVNVHVSAVDALDPPATCQISNVTSNQGSNADWHVTGALTLMLLADRVGNGGDRVYSITVQCADTLGNTSSSATAVTVPHDQGR